MLLDSVGVIVYFFAYESCPLGASIAGLVFTCGLLAWKYGFYVERLAQTPPQRTTFPKHLDLLMLLLFTALCCVTWKKLWAQRINNWNNFIWTASFFAVSALSLIFNSPFFAQYVCDKVPEKEWDKPEFRNIMWDLTVIWTIGFLLMSITCAILPALGINNVVSTEALTLNWVLPFMISVITVIFQNFWTARSKNSGVDERTPIVSPSAIPGSYESMTQDVGEFGVVVGVHQSATL
jgi:hypothetical protein